MPRSVPNKASTDQQRGIPWRSLTFQLLAIVVFPLIVLVLAVTIGSTTLHQNAMRQLVAQRDERAARMASNAVQEQVQRRANEVQGLARQVGYAGLDQSGQVLHDANYLQGDFDAGLAVLGPDGSVIAVQGNSNVWDKLPGTVTSGLQALMNHSEQSVFISQPFTLPGEQQPLVVALAPTPNGNAAAAGAFSITSLANIFTGAFQSQLTTATVIGPNGRVLSSEGSGGSAALTGQQAIIDSALGGQTGTVTKDINGSEWVIAYSPVQPYGWALLIGEPWEQTASPYLQTTHLAPLILVPISLLALLALFFGVRQVVQPLQALAVESGRLGWGDYDAIEKPVGGIAEIRQLQQELIHMAGKLKAAQQSLRSYIGAITSGQEEERRRLARELHDDTIQSLIAFKQRIQLLEMDYTGEPVTKGLGELETSTEQTIENLRRMVAALRPIYLEDLGLVAAVQMLANNVAKDTGIQIDFHRSGKEQRLDAPVELALYRIVQEALSNIARHSRASRASVQIAFQPKALRIEVEDNGNGFLVPRSPSEFAPSGHFGLLGMFERADLVGAKIQIDSELGKGTNLVVSVN